MKRSEALTPLSHDHHQALVVAQRLRRAESASGPAAEEFRRFWREQGRPHFRIEEEVLLPIWQRLGTPDPEQIARVAQEHLAIRALALAVMEGEAELGQLQRLGELMQAHVRYEERELFPLIEKDLGPAAQQRLATAVLEAETA